MVRGRGLRPRQMANSLLPVRWSVGALHGFPPFLFKEGIQGRLLMVFPFLESHRSPTGHILLALGSGVVILSESEESMFWVKKRKRSLVTPPGPSLRERLWVRRAF
ncbi:protein of unknown function [Nitrospina watsonii]|uniref:Uncharacterized protein n=1 Tax=Nitrospina watsonii TaxID=1323948 RepID=A0ABM9HA78_9BACT|nr:protein of unknown function [Nitrospina watsonii]